jgi:hypothetical protein
MSTKLASAGSAPSIVPGDVGRMRRAIAPLTIVVLVLASCGGDPGESANGASATPVSASSTATSDRLLVSGTAVCDILNPDTEGTKGGVSTYKATLSCAEEMSDPRVSGQDECRLTEAAFEGGDAFIAWFRCENQTLTTDGGTWQGESYGSEFTYPGDGGLYTTGHATFIGEGAYEGLVYEQLYSQSPEADHYLVAGWIEPAAP